MKVKVIGYDRCKYDITSQKAFEVEYSGVKGFEVKEMSTEEFYAEGFNEDEDDYKEYCLITMEDGSISTFRNSYIDLFILSRRG